MKTILSIVLLIVFGVIANFLSVFLLNVAGLPGALLAGTPGKRSKRRFISGSIVSSIGQSYVYLSYTAFIVNWTKIAGGRDDVVGFPLWIFAFLAVIVPIWIALIRARVESQETEVASPQVEADLPPFIVTHAKLELHDHKPLGSEVCIPKNCAAGIDCILYANTL